MSARHVALLRGINVGGANTLPMADLRATAETLGWQEPRTHIASGNLVFSATGTPKALATDLAKALHRRHGLDIALLVQTAAQFQATLAACPFAPEDARHAHVFWLLGPPRLDQALCDSLRAESETLILGHSAAYLDAPEGIGRSRLAARMERVLGTRLTGRNLRTARAISALLD